MLARPWPAGLILLIFLVGIWLVPTQQALAQDIPAGTPAGFQLIAEQPGVALYRKDYTGGSPDFVQVVDLAAGASIDLLYGDPVAMNNAHNQGMFGGPNPSFRQRTIHDYWDSYASTHESAFCVANGQFFYMPESPTPLALPLLVERQLLGEGFGYSQYPEKQLMLALWPDHADILQLTPENLASTDAESVLGGLTEEANKKPKNAVGRTFVGIWDRDSDLRYEMVAIYTTQTATQAEAARTVRSFGASKVMMLDGGGSTQLICQGQTYIDTTRAIPQALGVSAASASAPIPDSHAPIDRATNPLSIENSPAIEGAPGIKDQTQPSGVEDTASTPNIAEAQPGSQPDQLLETAPPSAEIPDPTPAVQTQTLMTITSGLAITNTPGAGIDPMEERPGEQVAAGELSVIRAPSRSGQANVADVLLLPVIIPPLSVILVLVARRQIFPMIRDG